MKRRLLSILMGFMMVASIGLVGCQSGSETNKAENEAKAVTETAANESEAKASETEKETNKMEKVDGGTMIVRVASDSRVIHPLYGNDRTTLTLVNHIFSPLYILNGDEVDYWLAQEVKPSEDYLSYTLKLKEGLTWHDGEAISADDLVFTFNTIMDDNQGSHTKSSFVTSKGDVKIEKVDDLTVKFLLPEVQVGFLDTIGGIRMFPKHVYQNIENIQASDVNNHPIGSGPFKFESRNEGETITLARFDKFFEGAANLEKVVFRIIPDSASAEIAFKNGEIDVMNIHAEDVQKLDGEAEILAFDEDRVGYIIINENNEVLKNQKLRQAIAYAINRDEVLKATYMSTDYAKPAYSFLADKALYKTDDVEKYAFNPEKAKTLLKESGLENVTLTMAYIGKDDIREILVQKYLSDVGINVELKAMDMASFYNALFDPAHNNSYDLAFNGYIYGKEPSAYAQIFETGSMNNVNSYTNPEVDKLWNLAAKEIDKSKREQLYKDIQQKIMEDVPMYPISYGYAIVAVNPHFKGLEEAEPAPIHMFNDLSKIYMVK
ncbi:MAG: ABC transporter substrate-binding protein [Tissierellales bacterium]|nr:ABC transporter substrate-binding protein [Tissierellales bacterium]